MEGHSIRNTPPRRNNEQHTIPAAADGAAAKIRANRASESVKFTSPDLGYI